MYLDAGHGGWLGWDKKASDFMDRVCRLGLMEMIRGFSTNVANYDPVGSVHTACPETAFLKSNVAHYCQFENPTHVCCQYDPCERIAIFNSAPTELVYTQASTKQIMSRTDDEPLSKGCACL